ncbi:MAG: alpha/beta fold hydrolase [Acidobacteria bacterium]|nr:alpha/beta fold hydrolase [Acidobacteriota bacterium]
MLEITRIIFLLTIFAPAAGAPSVRTEWIGIPGQRTKAKIFEQSRTGKQILAVILHGDAPFTKPSYQYLFAQKLAEAFPQVVAVALLRPGYMDIEGDTSDGNRGNATADNYTPEVIQQLDSAATRLKEELHPSFVVLVGHSGGAAIAADMMARDPKLADAALLVSCPCDVPAFRDHMKTIAPTPLWNEPVRSISPLSAVDYMPRNIAIRLIVGERDNVAPPVLAERYARALQKHGIGAQLSVLAGRGHEILLDKDVVEEFGKLVRHLS